MKDTNCVTYWENDLVLAATQKISKAVMNIVPGPHVRHLVSHLAQSLGCAKYISALLACT